MEGPSLAQPRHCSTAEVSPSTPQLEDASIAGPADTLHTRAGAEPALRDTSLEYGRAGWSLGRALLHRVRINTRWWLHIQTQASPLSLPAASVEPSLHLLDAIQQVLLQKPNKHSDQPEAGTASGGARTGLLSSG